MPRQPDKDPKSSSPSNEQSCRIVSPDEILAPIEAEERQQLSDRPQIQRYPERRMPIAGSQPRAEIWQTDDSPPPTGDDYDQALARYDLFSHARERLLTNYRYNTGRAYWGDVDDIFFWCEYRGFDILDLTDKDFRQYVGLLRRRKYSENTIRRRGVAYRLFRRVADAE